MYGGGKGEEGEEIERLFEDGKWDRSKMVRRFATFGVADGGGKEKEVEIDNTEVSVILERLLILQETNSCTQRGKILKYDLKSTNDSRWTLVKKVIAQAEHSKEPNSNSNKEQSGNNSVSGNTRNAATSEEEEEAISDEISVESLSTSVAKLGVGEDSKDKKIKTGAVVDARREIRAKMYLGKVRSFPVS
jgi:phosphatidylinositol-3,4,5-trisphosphate 3-phosphatase/dual-specificity protein phosphatase PTEN